MGLSAIMDEDNTGRRPRTSGLCDRCSNLLLQTRHISLDQEKNRRQGTNFKNIAFTIDRYVVSKSKVATETFTADGSTTTFEVDEIVHQEDILVKEGSEIVSPGEGWTASGFAGHLNPTADTELRSADHEYGISLTYDSTTNKTTITFTKEVPTAGTIIKVDRSNDKYLKFRDKGIQ